MRLLLLLLDFLPFPGEDQFLAFIRANLLALFPKRVAQSQFSGLNGRTGNPALARYGAPGIGRGRGRRTGTRSARVRRYGC